MRHLAMALATAGLVVGALAGAQTASAASTIDTNNVTTPAWPATPPWESTTPIISALDCAGTTGWAGCGPGWIWRDGWRGFACYVC